MNGKEMNAKCSDSSRLLRRVQMTLSRTYRDICICMYIHMYIGTYMHYLCTYIYRHILAHFHPHIVNM